MRTTLDIDDDVLAAAKALGRRSQRSAGAVISELARSALTAAARPAARAAVAEPKAFYGFKPQAAQGLPVTDDLVDRLREAAGD
jgi:hypothetical protein